MKTNSTRRVGRPRTSAYQAAKTIASSHYVDTKRGLIFNEDGQIVGSNTYEPRVSVRFNGKKYNVRQNKVIGLVAFGPEALRRGVSVRHKNGDKTDNRRTNLELVYSPSAARAYRRLQAQ